MPDELVVEGVLREVREELARDYPPCAAEPFQAGIPRERWRAERHGELDGVAISDGAGAPGRDSRQVGMYFLFFSAGERGVRADLIASTTFCLRNRMF